MKEKIEYYLNDIGYKKLSAAIPGFTIFFELENGYVNAIMLVDQAVKLGIADRIGSLNTLKRELKTERALNYTIEYSPFESVLGRMGSSIGDGIATSVAQKLQSENSTTLQ